MRTYMGIDIPDRFDERADPAVCALVVVDMQNDFAHPEGHCARFADVGGFRTVIEPLTSLAHAARAAGVPVVFVCQVQRPDGLYASPVWLADNLRTIEATGVDLGPVQCMEGTWGAQIVDELAPLPGDVVVPKQRRSAFQGTNLAHMLGVLGRTTVVVSGIAALGCVEATVRNAIEEDFFVIVPHDCIGDSTEERLQAAKAVFARLLQPGDLTGSADLVDRWGRDRRAR